MSTLLWITVIFLGLTSLGFVGTWLLGFFQDVRSNKPIQKPWD